MGKSSMGVAMKKTISGVFLFLLLVPAMGMSGMSSEMSPLCGTSWDGRYFYPVNQNKQLERPPVPFVFSFVCSGDTIKGRTTEASTFGDKTSENLYANVSIEKIEDGDLVFVKTYDGTGGVSHSVRYIGNFKTNRFIYGIWNIAEKDGSTYSGYFEMHR
jgi:hypothetical protein